MKIATLIFTAGLLFPVAALADSIDAQALYKDNCSKCHGDNGMAHTTRGYVYFARNFTSTKWQASRSDEDIYNTISNGPGWWSVMPVFKKTLSEDERHALVKVVRGFGRRVNKRNMSFQKDERGMALFNFTLDPLESIQPWGAAPKQSLSWFGLTYGVYSLNVGSETLFEYSDEIVSLWREKYPGDQRAVSLVDYQVSRLHEDILDLLPEILNAVPPEIARLVESPDATDKWLLSLSPDLEKDFDTYYQAAGWWFARSLDSGHLMAGPQIHFWRTADLIQVRWDNTKKCIDGIQPWASVSGEYTLPVDDFVNEVRSFHERLMGEMSARIDAVLRGKLFPGVHIDLLQLTKEQKERSLGFDAAIGRTSKGDRSVHWAEILRLSGD